MRRSVALFVFLFAAFGAQAQQSPTAKAPASGRATGQPPASAPIETETINVRPAAPAPVSKPPGEPGGVEPALARAALHKLWMAEYRINDLLSQEQPEKWKVSDAARHSYYQAAEALRKQLATFENWRGQFEKRPESPYLGHETYVSINRLVPLLDGVARAVSQDESSRNGAEYSKAGDQILEQQQALESYLSLLLRNQDAVLLGWQNNLANCQNELNFAMRSRSQRAIPMKNINPRFQGWRVRKAQEARAAGGKAGDKNAPKKPQPGPSAGSTLPSATAITHGDKRQ
jgi:hypothetical protein